MSARLDTRGHSVLAGIALVLAACSPVATRPPPLPAAAAARLAAVQAAEGRVQTLRARFSSVSRFGSGERRADGVLLVAKPDRFRLRLLLPFGLTVFDYLAVGDRSWMVLPLASPAERAQADTLVPFSHDDLGEAFLRGPYAFPGECVASPGDGAAVTVSCRSGGDLRRTLVIGRDGISEETSYANGDPRLQIRYGDYREVDGVALPFHVLLDYPQRQQSVDIAIQHYEVNPVLPAALFAPAPGSTAQPAARARLRGGPAAES